MHADAYGYAHIKITPMSISVWISLVCGYYWYVVSYYLGLEIELGLRLDETPETTSYYPRFRPKLDETLKMTPYYTCIYTHIYIYVCVYVCVCIYIYIYIYIYIHRQIKM